MEEGNEKEIVQSIGYNNVPQEKEDYSIVNYFKEHHGLLIATTSAIVAIFSFIINIVNYLSINSYLTFWDVEISHVKLNSSNQIYSVFAAFFFQVIILFITMFISSTYDSYEERQELFLYRKWRQKETSKQIKKLNKELSASEKRLKKIKNASKDTEKIKELQGVIDSLEEKLDLDKQEMKEIKKCFRKRIKQEKFLLFMSNVIAFLFVFWGCIILFTTLVYCDKVVRYSLFLGLLFVGINVLIHGGINYLVAKSNMKKIDNKELEEIRYKDLPIEKMILGKWNLIVSNKSLKSIFIQIFVFTFVFIFSFASAGYAKAREQKDFQYLTSGNETYVVIFNNSEDLVTKKAFIDNSNIVIDLSEQMTISVKDVTLHKRKFSTVEILRLQ